MNASKAKQILGLDQMTQHQLYHNSQTRFIDTRGDALPEGEIRMIGRFTADELEAVAYWMRHREEFGNGDTDSVAHASGDVAIGPGDPDWDDELYGPGARADAARDAGG